MRVPDWTNQYSIESSGPVMRTLSPVSSSTSRMAVCSRLSPGSGVPLGSVQVRPSRSRRRLPTTSHGWPDSYRTTIPPAEVAVEVLRPATAPTRRPGGGPRRDARSGPTPWPPADAAGRCACRLRDAPDGSHASWPAGGRAVRPPDRAAPSTGGPARVNEPDGRRPSRRSRTRVEGRTNRAAGRAAYLAAML